MKFENIVDAFIWGGIPIARKLPTRPLRFIGIFVAWLLMVISCPIWVPLALIMGLKEIWDDCKKNID